MKRPRKHGLYLLHFEPRFHHAGHYLGYSDDIPAKVALHREGKSGVRMVSAAVAAGCKLMLVRTWPGNRVDERRLKGLRNNHRVGSLGRAYCPACDALKRLSGGAMSDYTEFRGKCKELAEQAVAADHSLTLVRGYYHCPLWGKRAHWWCTRADGTIVDPSVKQFPTQGVGAEYEEYDGHIECEYCHKAVHESHAYFYCHHAYCSYTCFGHDIGF